MHEEWTLLKRLIWLWRAVGGAAAVLKTVTGALLHITDALAKPAHELVAVLSPVQSGTGDPSPDNVRPISGWTGANISDVAGKNFFDPNSTSEIWYGPSSPTVVSGAKESRVRATSGDRYIFSIGERLNSTGIAIVALDAAGNVLTRAGSSTQLTVTITCPANTYYVAASVQTYANVTNPQLERGNTATTYEAYRGSVLPINWQSEAGTIYGGTLTLNEDGSADLVVDREAVDMGTLSFSSTSAYGAGKFYANIPSRYNANASVPALQCEIYKSAGKQSAYYNNNLSIWYYANTGFNRLFLQDTNYYHDGEYDLTGFQESINGKLVVLNLRNSLNYHFDNIGQLMLFAGENNIWVDASDDLTLTYYADGNVSDLEALNTLLGGTYTPGDVSDREALNILLGN